MKTEQETTEFKAAEQALVEQIIAAMRDSEITKVRELSEQVKVLREQFYGNL